MDKILEDKFAELAQFYCYIYAAGPVYFCYRQNAKDSGKPVNHFVNTSCGYTQQLIRDLFFGRFINDPTPSYDLIKTLQEKGFISISLNSDVLQNPEHVTTFAKINNRYSRTEPTRDTRIPR